MINLFVWSGPRNISTALMRSFENRKDTKVYDEPFYAYYLKKTNLNHPMKDEIINHYHTNEDEVIKLITTDDDKYEIFYQKHEEMVSTLDNSVDLYHQKQYWTF